MSTFSSEIPKTREAGSTATDALQLPAIPGYVSREHNLEAHVEAVRRGHGLERVRRFDLGQNNLGSAPAAARRLEAMARAPGMTGLLRDYPAFDTRPLERRIAELHEIDPGWILLSAGIEQMIGQIAAAILGRNERYVVNVPSFFVFDGFSDRVGAAAVRLELREEDRFDWTLRTIGQLRGALNIARPRVVWVATPNNPTGRALSEPMVEAVAREAARHGALVVFDEAYGEYVDPEGGVRSATSLLHRFDNVIVLRTLSKAYGLAGIRVGYAMTSNEAILAALRRHSCNFPIPQLSLELATAAFGDHEFLATTRRETARLREVLLQRLDAMPRIRTIASDCCILMVGHESLGASELHAELERHGVFTARIPCAGEIGEHYLRITLRDEADNAVLAEHLGHVG